METSIQTEVSRNWKRACLFLGFIIVLYGLSAYFHRAKFTHERHPPASIKTSTMNFRDSEYLIVIIAGTWSHTYPTATIETRGDRLNVYFKSRGSLFPKIAIEENTTVFNPTSSRNSHKSWHQVFAFKIADNINVIVDASTEAILWQRKDVLNGE